ncbi:hypothetical protein BCR44DRAFT_190144 [Catenaria anguillulae PL171]|uniref:Uncharacterized protein n=1 Tax=Catenaria anguillulae PL171 TaxID=765915 RepID=A0A1Y2HB97_9FUNG|nr:hypothetical protein BCR44DRAFT_190144 [Catenaria anguillulae PL171]
MHASTPLLLTLALVASLVSAAPTQLHKRRFGQENPAVLNEIRALSRLPGVPSDGRFDQIAGAFISTLLAGADACARYALIDEIVTRCNQFNCQQQGVAVARKLAGLEKNFNPFAGANAKPAFCTNTALPASPEVRCIVPVIDPGFAGAAAFNTRAQATVQGANANQCEGQSVAQLAVNFGLTDCVGCAGLQPGNPPADGGDQGEDGQEGGDQGDGQDGGDQGDGQDGGDQGDGQDGGDQNGGDDQNGGGDQGQGGDNLQTFTGALLGAAAPQVRNVGGARPFQVILANGQVNGDFVNLGAALNRSCDVQKNLCANIANSAQGRAQGASVNQCDQQNGQCKAAIRA